MAPAVAFDGSPWVAAGQIGGLGKHSDRSQISARTSIKNVFAMSDMQLVVSSLIDTILLQYSVAWELWCSAGICLPGVLRCDIYSHCTSPIIPESKRQYMAVVSSARCKADVY